MFLTRTYVFQHSKTIELSILSGKNCYAEVLQCYFVCALLILLFYAYHEDWINRFIRNVSIFSTLQHLATRFDDYFHSHIREKVQPRWLCVVFIGKYLGPVKWWLKVNINVPKINLEYLEKKKSEIKKKLVIFSSEVLSCSNVPWILELYENKRYFHRCEKIYKPGGRQYKCRTRELLDNSGRKKWRKSRDTECWRKGRKNIYVGGGGLIKLQFRHVYCRLCNYPNKARGTENVCET